MLIKRRGGVAVVQDPATAVFPDMPRSAVRNVDVDYVVPLEAMPALFARLASEGGEGRAGETVTAGGNAAGVQAMAADIYSGSEEEPNQQAPNTIERKQ